MSDPSFSQMRVAAFESRRAEEMSRMIERYQGQPFVSPSMQELPLDSNHAALNAAKSIMTGGIDIAIFLTGVGFNYFMTAVHRQVDEARLIAALTDITTIARGPKPVAAMKAVGLQPKHVVAEPNTWRELLDLIDERLVISNQNILVQEYGKPNPSLIAGLEARGGRVSPLAVYRWGLPEETDPLRANVTAIANAEREVALFTSAQQVVHLLQVAREMDCESELRQGLARTVIGSIGPTTTEALLQNDLNRDFEPAHPKMGHLVQTAASHGADLHRRKTAIREQLSSPSSDPIDRQAPWYDSPFMKACRREPTEVTPIWLMRQAGRYLPQYRAIRKKFSFLELCKRPDVCAEIMIDTVQTLGVDAAIIFSDLLPILEPMGFELEYAVGDGPVIHNPIRDSAEVDRVMALDTVDALDFVMETVRRTRADLP
ncbi:MAG: uroporphyrinogen decarboxylase family protein, partial [Planctomycetota bacterium]